MSHIKENLVSVNNRISEAQSRSKLGRETNLIAVSKTKPIEDLIEAYKCGIRDFGENKVQEIVDKIDRLPGDARFHMIGHLQKNKVKYIVGRVFMIHSVDSYELASVIEKESAKKDVISDILIEVNVAEEESKFGVKPEDALELIKRIRELPHVRVRGLMTVAPYVEDPEENRQYFVDLRKLLIDIQTQCNDNNISILSMGMTGDFEVATEEGSSYVRVGTGIFGARNYDI